MAQDDACAQHTPASSARSDVSCLFCWSVAALLRLRAHALPSTRAIATVFVVNQSINPRRASLPLRVRPASSGHCPLLAAHFACRSKEALLCILRASQWRRRCSLRHSAAHCPVLPAENDRPATHSSRQALPDRPCSRAFLALTPPTPASSVRARWPGPDEPVDGCLEMGIDADAVR